MSTVTFLTRDEIRSTAPRDSWWVDEPRDSFYARALTEWDRRMRFAKDGKISAVPYLCESAPEYRKARRRQQFED